MNYAIFAGGCFWGVEHFFKGMLGVSSVISGYSGGHTENPTYEDVLTGTTGHIEVVQVEYDPNIVSYNELLDMFFKIHDPTTIDRQGPDIGEQYKSVIFYNNDEEKDLAQKKLSQYKQENDLVDTGNVKQLKINENISVKDLLKKYKLKEKQIAIELNGTILPKQNYKKKIKNRDKIEIVHFIGGG